MLSAISAGIELCQPSDCHDVLDQQAMIHRDNKGHLRQPIIDEDKCKVFGVIRWKTT